MDPKKNTFPYTAAIHEHNTSINKAEVMSGN